MNARGILLETPGARLAPMHWPLRQGERKVLTLGSNADWSLPDGDLLPVHATLYFDGASLCVAAAPGALLNGEPLGRDWSPLSLPAQLSLGETKITLASSDAGEERSRTELDALNQKTTLLGFPDLEEFRRAARAAQLAAELERHPPVPEEGDRITPTGLIHSPVADPDATQFAVPALGPAIPPAPPTPAVLPSPAAPITARQPLATSPAPARTTLLGSWQSASWPKRLSLMLLPVVLALYTIKAVRQHGRVKRAAPAARASATASAPRSTALVTSAAAPPIAPLPLSSAEGHALGPTLQRRAVDAFASGNYQEAAALYQHLASENPGEPAFAVAARLAKERANGAGHE